MGKTISQLDAQGAGSRSKDDRFEIENASSQSKQQTRQNGITVLESPLITLDSSNRDVFTTQIELVAAPGNALQVLVPIGIMFFLDAGGTVFDYAGSLFVINGTDTANQLMAIPAADINSATDVTKYVPMNSSDDLIFNDNLAIYSAANPTQGNGTAYFRLIYSLQDFNV